MLAVLGSVIAVAACPATAGARLGHAERAMIRLVNDIRSQNGRVRLRPNRALSRAAESHSRDMLANDFFHHNSSDGTPFGTRVGRYAKARLLGETLAMIPRRHGGAARVVRLWMQSPPHREVLLGSGYRRIGIARRWGMIGPFGQAVVTADLASW